MISELRIPPGARRRVHSPSLGGRERKAARETKVPDKPWRYRNLSTFQELLRNSISTFTPPPPAPSTDTLPGRCLGLCGRSWGKSGLGGGGAPNYRIGHPSPREVPFF